MLCFHVFQDPGNYKSFAYGDRVFRGEEQGEHLIRSCYKPDWRLVPKHEEATLLNRSREVRPRRLIKDTMPFPPLMQHLMMKQRKATSTEDIGTLKLTITRGAMNRAVLETST